MLVWVGTAPGVTWGHGYNMRFRMMRWSEHPLIHDSATCTASRRVKRLNTQGGGGVRAGEETHWGGACCAMRDVLRAVRHAACAQGEGGCGRRDWQKKRKKCGKCSKKCDRKCGFVRMVYAPHFAYTQQGKIFLPINSGSHQPRVGVKILFLCFSSIFEFSTKF